MNDSNGQNVVLGPPSCGERNRHHVHVIGCLDCAAAVAESDDYDLGEFLDLMEHIGWPKESTRGHQEPAS